MLSNTRELWRLVKELDLDSIRAEAEQPFRLVVAADSASEAAQGARTLMGPGSETLHPWIDVLAVSGADVVADGAIALLAITSGPQLSPALAQVRARFVEAGRPVIVGLTGTADDVDLVARGGEAARVALRGDGAADSSAVVGALLDAGAALPDLALARQLPAFRSAVFTRLVERTSKANATYALTTGLAETVPIVSAPLNLADIVILTKNQLLMAYRIALGAGRTGRPRDLLAEIVAVIGSGFLLRQGARQLVGLVPVIGIVPKVAIAYAGTWAVGRAMIGWALHGQPLTSDLVARFYEDARRRGRDVARRLVQQRRSRRPRE